MFTVISRRLYSASFTRISETFTVISAGFTVVSRRLFAMCDLTCEKCDVHLKTFTVNSTANDKSLATDLRSL